MVRSLGRAVAAGDPSAEYDENALEKGAAYDDKAKLKGKGGADDMAWYVASRTAIQAQKLLDMTPCKDYESVVEKKLPPGGNWAKMNFQTLVRYPKEDEAILREEVLTKEGVESSDEEEADQTQDNDGKMPAQEEGDRPSESGEEKEGPNQEEDSKENASEGGGSGGGSDIDENSQGDNVTLAMLANAADNVENEA